MKIIFGQRIFRSRHFAAIGAGLLLASAFPNFNFAGCAWIAPALMLACAIGKTGGESFRIGYTAGLSFWLASLYWLLHMPVNGFPILGWIALCAFLALFSGFWVWLIFNFKFQISNWISRTVWLLGGAAAWVALEMIRARIFSGFPWSFLGVSQFKMIPLIQIASVTGVYGISFLVVWFSLALFSAARMIFLNPARRHVWQAEIAFPLIVIVLLFVFGWERATRENSSGATLRVTLIQPSIPQTLIWNPDADADRFQKLLRLSENALTNQTDLLIWPEAAVPELDEATYGAITNLIGLHHVPIIFNSDEAVWRPNAKDKNDFNVFNSAFSLDPDGFHPAVYHKQNLVIFGEYVPLVRWLPFIKWFTPITGSFTPGDKPAQFEITRRGENAGEPTNTISLVPANNSSLRQTVKISPLICFEDTFPGTARDATDDDTDFLVNLTNDGWFGEGAEQWQHCANAVFRAVENGLPLVRCANNGVTCWIDAQGRVREIFTDPAGNIHGPGALTAEIPIGGKREPTFYHRHGDWFGWSCVAVTVLIVLLRMKKKFPAA